MESEQIFEITDDGVDICPMFPSEPAKPFEFADMQVVVPGTWVSPAVVTQGNNCKPIEWGFNFFP
jgi:hypothetical protein